MQVDITIIPILFMRKLKRIQQEAKPGFESTEPMFIPKASVTNTHTTDKTKQKN